MSANNTMSYFKSIKLSSLSRDEYDNIKSAGMLHVIYPEACGIYEDDTMQENPDGVSWPSTMEEIETVYDPPKDGMFTDDYIAGQRPSVDSISPDHYRLGKLNVEAIDVIEAVLESDEAQDFLTPQEGYCYGNVLKYLLRAPRKNGKEDIAKAFKYLEWLMVSLDIEEV